MSPRSANFSVPGLILRIIARCLAVSFIIVLLFLMMPEEGGSFLGQWAWDWRSLDAWTLVFPFVYLLGLVLILWKDAWGAIVSVGCILAMYFRFVMAGDSLDLAMLCGAVPGILAIFAWNLSRNYVPRPEPRPHVRGGV